MTARHRFSKPEPKRELGWSAAWALGAILYLWPLRRQGFQINDDGWYLHPVLRMLEGEVLYRDIWTFYAPFEHHLFAALFRLTGPSMLAARTLWVAILAVAVVLTWRAARRLAPASLAWIPPALYGLAPGQWSKAFYGLCSALFFSAAAWTLARPRADRCALLGLVVGGSLVSRQDLGLAQLGLGAVMLLVPSLAPARFALPEAGRFVAALARLAAFFAGVALPVLLVLAYYASHDALAELLDATLVHAFGQRFESGYAAPLTYLFSPGSFLQVAEGRLAGLLLVLPLFAVVASSLLLLRRLLRRGIDAEAVLVGALIAYVAVGLLNSLYQLRLLRLLETGVPFYLLAAWAATALLRSCQARGRPAAARGAVQAAALAAALYMGAILIGLPQVMPTDDYTGSVRGMSLDEPTEVLGETFYVDWGHADEYRQVRQYLEPRLEEGDPLWSIPLISGYYLLFERQPNPTRVVHVHFRNDWTLTEAQKHDEVRRLLESPVRYVVTMHSWIGWPEAADPLRRALYQHFHPVREYGSVTILARNGGESSQDIQPGDPVKMALYRRWLLGRSDENDIAPLRAWARAQQDEPLPWLLLGRILASQGQTDAAVAALRRAAKRDRANPGPRVEAAMLRLQQGRREQARQELLRVLEVQKHPVAQDILERIGAEGS